MLNSNNERELAYLVKVDAITPMNADRLECAHIGGWHCVVGKGEFQVGDFGVYFEIDAQLPEIEPFASMEFLKSKHYKIKSQKIRGEISQGLLMPISAFGWHIPWAVNEDNYILDENDNLLSLNDETRFLTKRLNVTYAVAEDNARKSSRKGPDAKLQSVIACNPKFFSNTWVKKLLHYKWFRKMVVTFAPKKKTNAKDWPDGHFDGVKRTDQERAENMTWVLNDKTPFIVTQKCDGSSGTYILERKRHNKFEFYVCSRNVRMANKEQECFYGEHNYYWEVADKYNIEAKMHQWLNAHPKATFVCWQGEICAPGIQSNPHHLKETHFYCFHWTDSINGRRDIREAVEDWHKAEMETVPIVDTNYIMPDDFEIFKKSADGKYDASVCEGNSDCAREGFVYYKTTDPTFSFKNVSREYLLKH